MHSIYGAVKIMSLQNTYAYPGRSSPFVFSAGCGSAEEGFSLPLFRPRSLRSQPAFTFLLRLKCVVVDQIYLCLDFLHGFLWLLTTTLRVEYYFRFWWTILVHRW